MTSTALEKMAHDYADLLPPEARRYMRDVPTMIAGIYGMNFAKMPELAWKWGYPALLTLIATICGTLYLTFRRNHWL
ncbi:MAG: hypothetical protein FGM52_03735 [Mycobacterium sp.]|nr:hypothetical protein [Mycobacterium sp.]